MRPYFFPCILCVLLYACGPQQKSLPDYFPLRELPDTLYFAIAEYEETVQADTLANAIFFGALSSEMISDIAYVADSAEAVVLARGRYVLDARYDAICADARYVWFQHQSLLLYDKEEKRITDRITVAEWYGGESGQILVGAWLLDLDGDGNRELVQRQASHSMRIENDEAIESTEQYVSLWQHRGGRFVEMPVQDSAKLIQAFSLPDMW